MYSRSVFPLLFFVSILALSSCGGTPDEGGAPAKRAEPEVRMPSIPAPLVERSDVGDVMLHTTTARGSERVITTNRWMIEFGSLFPADGIETGDWVDLLTVRLDEQNTFQYLCTTTMRECRRVIKIRKLLPGEGNEALLSDRPPTPSY